MKIHGAEKSLAKILEDSTKVVSSIVLPMSVKDDNIDLFIDNLENIKKNGCDSLLGRTLAKIAKYPHPDLVYGGATLVSTIINKNDDVFLPEETWKAKDTPVNTPFNDQHVELDIIGHIIAARPLDSEGKIIEAQEPPEYFDIGVDFVIYSGIFPDLANEIKEKAPKGEKFVSMEAKFKDFDYALVDASNSVKIVSRNEATAFLTKYLRAYGGDGKYKDYKVARVLRDFRFVGMGNVDVPANPTSEYTKFEQYETATQADLKLQDSPKVVLFITKGKTMKVETLEQALTEIEKLTAQLDEQKGKNQQAELDKLKADNQTLSEQLDAEKQKVETATTQVNELNTKVETLTNELNTAQTEAKAKAEELAKQAKETKANDRVAKLKELGVEVSAEKREKIANMSDEVFADLVEFTETIKKSGENKGEENKGGEPSEADAATNKAEKDMANAQTDPNKGPEATAGANTTEGDDIKKTAAGLVEQLMKHRSPRNGPKINKKG